MSTPTPVAPPTEETVEVYRAAVLTYRESIKAEREKHGSFKMNPHIPKHAAAEAVLKVRPDLSFQQAARLAHQATSWTAQAHWKWFWKGVSPIAD
jgi:phage terminase small subunit